MIKMIDSILTKRILEGSKMLDRKSPGWYDRINVDIIDLSNGYNCVWGQLNSEGRHFSSFPEDFKEEFIDFDSFTERHGFMVPPEALRLAPNNYYGICKIMDSKWKEEILRKREIDAIEAVPSI